MRRICGRLSRLLWVVTLLGSAVGGAQSGLLQAMPDTKGSADRSRASRPETVGKLLEVVSPNTPILKTPDRQGHALLNVKQGEYLAQFGAKGDYYGVLMADGSRGFVSIHDVRVLEYVVIPLKPERNRAVEYREHGHKRGMQDAKSGRKDLRPQFKRDPASARAYMVSDSRIDGVKDLSAKDMALRLTYPDSHQIREIQNAFIEGYAAGYAEQSSRRKSGR